MALIEREALLKVLEEWPQLFEKLGVALSPQTSDMLTDCIRAIHGVKAMDAAPVVHGRWIMRGGRFRCSVCDAKALWRDIGGTGGFSHEYEQATTDVCPNCGARMNGGEGREAD